MAPIAILGEEDLERSNSTMLVVKELSGSGGCGHRPENHARIRSLSLVSPMMGIFEWRGNSEAVKGAAAACSA